VPNRLIAGRLALLAALSLPVPASAHAILEESTPRPGASVQAGALDLRFRYNSRVDQARSRLTLIRSDHSREAIAIVPDTPPDILAAHLELSPGDYVVRWQVLAVDGHITRGDVPFSVRAP
jgi:methionine-rich copper-binding protein CopC